jgi:adenine-specific DNA glycosylase
MLMQAVPVVDGNVIRVLCRLRAIALNPKASTTVKLFWYDIYFNVGPIHPCFDTRMMNCPVQTVLLSVVVSRTL